MSHFYDPYNSARTGNTIIVYLTLVKSNENERGDQCGTNVHSYDYCRAQQSLNIFEQIVYPPS